MANYSYEELERMAVRIHEGGLFGHKTWQETFTSLLVGLADGVHPIRGCTDYHILDMKGKRQLSLKASVAFGRFIDAGGEVEWLKYSDDECSAAFSFKKTKVTVSWDIARAKRAGLIGKDIYVRHTQQMLGKQVILEGINKTRPFSALAVDDQSPILEGENINPGDAPGDDDSAQQESQQAAQDAKKKTEEELAAKQQKDLLIKQMMETGVDPLILRDKRNANGWKSSADMSLDDVRIMLMWAKNVKDILDNVPKDILNKELLDRKWSLSSMDVAKIREMFSSYFERQPGDDDQQEPTVEG